jgi:hypothetical protein
MTGTPRFRIFKAAPEDEERLKFLYSEKSRDGAIRVNLERNPVFFDAIRVEGHENVVYAVEDSQTGLIAGAGIRNIRDCYLNGAAQKIGYLSGLRVAEKYRKSRAMAMIFIKLKQLYLQGECAGYLCSVFESNKTAIRVLTSGKAGMPAFKKVGRLITFVFKPVSLKSNKNPSLITRQAQNNDLEKLLAFLNTEGPKKQYFPHYTISDFNNSTGILKDLNISDVTIAFEKDEIVGCLALWNQTGFRRWKVEGYSAIITILRPVYNILIHFSTLPRLPEPHSNFNYRFLSLVCIKNNNRRIFEPLFNRAIERLDTNKDVLISASFFKNDPLILSFPILKMSFKSSIFIGNWKETQTEIDQIDSRSPYIEAGSL